MFFWLCFGDFLIRKSLFSMFFWIVQALAPSSAPRAFRRRFWMPKSWFRVVGNMCFFRKVWKVVKLFENAGKGQTSIVKHIKVFFTVYYTILVRIGGVPFGCPQHGTSCLQAALPRPFFTEPWVIPGDPYLVPHIYFFLSGTKLYARISARLA